MCYIFIKVWKKYSVTSKYRRLCANYDTDEWLFSVCYIILRFSEFIRPTGKENIIKLTL